MTGEEVERQQHDVGEHYQSAEGNAEVAIKAEGANGVIPEEAEKHEGKIHEVAVNILQNEGKRSFAAVLAVRALAYRARRRIEEECPVVGFAVVVAGHAKSQRSREDQERRGKRPVAVSRVN